MLVLLLSGVLTLSIGELRVETIDGQSYQGSLRSLTSEALTIQSEADQIRLPLDSVLTLLRTDEADEVVSTPEVEIGLGDVEF